MSKLLRGTFILTGAAFLSKFLGLIFIIPFANLVEDKGGALYGYAYIPYTILLSVATMGIPLAVSKFVSKYNALGDYATGRRLLKSGLVVMSITGFLAFLLLFFSADWIAHLLVRDGETGGNSTEDITLVIQMVSTALIIVPSMSLIRGYFQGFQSMGPTALSQVIEQILRIGVILIGSFLVLKVFHGSISTAVAYATFAATIGAIGGLIVLIWYWKKRKKHLDRQLEQSTTDYNIPLASMYKELITYAVPFVAVGLAIPIYLLIDQFTINQALMNARNYGQEQAEFVFGIMTQFSHKIIMIPVSLATGFALTLIPTITKSYTNREFNTLQSQVTQTFQVILFLTVPAAVGLSLLAFPAYKTLFVNSSLEIGGPILQTYAPTAILFAFFTVTAAILQGINQQRFAVISLASGVLLKLSLNYVLIANIGIIGAVWGTNIGYVVSILINGYVIKKYANYQYAFILKRALLILIFAGVMSLVVIAVKAAIDAIIPGSYEHYLQAVLILVFGVLAGAATYLWLGIKSSLAQQIFGKRLKFLQKKRKPVST
jgi:O-antigen/teichoic acid export membrane protein